MNVPDNYDQWLAHEAKQEKLLERLPVCRYCGEPVQDDYYFCIDGRVWCDECLNFKYRRYVEVDFYG